MSSKALTFPFIFIRVVAVVKSVNDVAITTELGEWRVEEVLERHTLEQWLIFTTSSTHGVPSKRMPIVSTKETRLSFKSRCWCYVFVWVAGVSHGGSCSTKPCLEDRVELFWAFSRALGCSNAVVRSRVTWSSRPCQILTNRCALIKASLITSVLFFSKHWLPCTCNPHLNARWFKRYSFSASFGFLAAHQ